MKGPRSRIYGAPTSILKKLNKLYSPVVHLYIRRQKPNNLFSPFFFFISDLKRQFNYNLQICTFLLDVKDLTDYSILGGNYNHLSGLPKGEHLPTYWKRRPHSKFNYLIAVAVARP